MSDSIPSDFAAMLGLSSEDPRVAYAVGVVYAALGDRARALAAFDETIREAPDYAEARYSRGVLLADMERLAEAVDELAAARKAFPRSIRLARELGRALRRQGKEDEAVALYRGAARGSRGESDAYLLHEDLGRVFYEEKRYEESAAELEAATRENPSDPSLRVNLGAAYVAGGRLEEAEGAFRAALSMNPDLLSALRNLGALYLQSKRFDEAVEALSRAVAIEPLGAKTLRKLALAYHGKGMEEEAERFMRRAIEIDSGEEEGAR